MLVVDDTRVDRAIARDAVEGVAAVTCCANAEEAIEALRLHAFDIVLSDLTMPGLSGLDLLERVRRDHPDTDVILVTGNASVDSAVQALRQGAADYLQKPVRPDELRLLLERTLERRRLRTENDRLRELLGTVDECRTLATSLDPGEIHGSALDLLLDRLSREHGVALFQRGASDLHDVTFRGIPERVREPLRERLLAEKPLEAGGIDQLEVVTSGPLFEALAGAGEESRVLVVPIRGRESEGGLLAVPEAGRPFGGHELALARLVAEQAAVAMRNAERYREAQERAFVDDVTGVYNARYLFAALDHEIRRAERYASGLVLLFLDVDRFKLVNDRHGHLIGSRTLRRLAGVLGECIRQVDTLARYGGDEFTILLADTDLETGLQVAERIRSSVAAARFEGQGAGPLQVTLSVGVAAFPTHGQSAEGLLDVADKAMYRAKSLGRNQTCSASDL